ncbi:cuticle collagen 13-like [Penaeus indicus]|uniref:cuticle collagen 13-like n=1 Tax=Penaeus indicus TaxID=29960 RepID=UPI00300D6CB0
MNMCKEPARRCPPGAPGTHAAVGRAPGDTCAAPAPWPSAAASRRGPRPLATGPDADGLAAVPFVVRRIIRRPGAAAGVGAAGALLSPEGVAGRPPAPRGAPTPGKKGRAGTVGSCADGQAALEPDGRRSGLSPGRL